MREDRPARDVEQFAAVVRRELASLRRERTIWALAAGFTVVVLATALLTEATSYVPLALALLSPLELLVPVLAVALGYRSVLADRERGELTVLRTYPIRSATYVLGVYVGRSLVVVPIVAATVLLAGLVATLSDPQAATLQSTAGLDSPVYYLRFVSLTALYAAVALALAVLLSSTVRSARRGLVLAVLLVLLLAVGLDLAAVVGLAGDVLPPGALEWVLALSPGSAYRSLVLSLVVAPVATAGVGAASPLFGLLGTAAWLLGSLGLAAGAAWEPARHASRRRRSGR